MGSNSPAKQMKVMLFGLGAIGGFYAFILGRNENISLTVVARSNFDAVKQNGLKIESENHGSHQVRINNVVQTPSDAVTAFDYVVCAHKAINPDSVPSIFRSVANDDTTFVVIQNGVGNEEPFRKEYLQNTIISCVTWVGAKQPTPGFIKHNKAEGTQMGLYPNINLPPDVEKARLDTFASLLQIGGTVFEVEDSIQVKRWEKVVWNAAWNPLTTLTDVDTHAWLKSSEEAILMTRRLMREVIDVARRCDVPIRYELINTLIDKILAMQPIFSSMHTDAKEGRPLEVDVIIGHPMKKAREFGMDVPTLSAVYAMIMAVNGRLTSSNP